MSFINVFVHNQNDYWSLEHKITVHTDTKLIYINDAVTDFDIKIDLYSDLKEWFKLRENSGFVNFPIRSIGGDPTITGQTAGDIYFMVDGWRVVIDLRKVSVTGVLFSDDYDSAWLNKEDLALITPIQVSSLVTSVTPQLDQFGIPTAAENAETLLSYDINNLGLSDTFGGMIKEQLHILEHLERMVWIDTERAEVGDGTQSFPFNDLTTAIDYAESEGINKLKVYADITLDRQLKNFLIDGVGTPTIDTNGQDLSKSEFLHCKMEGTYTGTIIVQESVLLNGFNLNGFFETCGLAGDLTCVDGSSVLLTQCISLIAGTGRPTISMNATGTTQLSIRKNGGGMTIKDCNQVTDAVTVEVSEGALTFDSSCSDGEMVARGDCELIDETTGATVLNQTSPNLVWRNS